MREQRVLEGRVVDASADISELKRQLDFAHTTIFELRTAQEEKDAAALAEAQIVTEDEARSAARLDALERENERLRKELSSERSGTGSAAQLAKTSAAKVENAMQQCANLRSDIAHRDDAIETLKDELADMRRQQASAEAHFQAERSAMSARIDAARTRADELQRSLAERPTAEEHSAIKSQLRLVREAEFDADDEESAKPFSGKVSS